MKKRRGPRYSVQVRSTPYGLEKRCVKCREWLLLDDSFYAHPRGAFGRANHCNECERLRKVERYRLTRPDLYAMTPEQRIEKRKQTLVLGRQRKAA